MPTCSFSRYNCCCIPFHFSAFSLRFSDSAAGPPAPYASIRATPLKMPPAPPYIASHKPFNPDLELCYSMPFTLKLKQRSPIMMWSNRSTAIKSAHSFSRSVTCMSAFDGRQSPDGWLWHSTNPLAPARRSRIKTSLGLVNAPFTHPCAISNTPSGSHAAVIATIYICSSACACSL